MSIKLHKDLVKKAMSEVVDNLAECLYGEHVLPGTISIPCQDEETGSWVRLSLKISELNIKKSYDKDKGD